MVQELSARTVDGMLYPVRKALGEDREVNLMRMGTEMLQDQVRSLSQDLRMKAGTIGGK